MRIVMQMVCRVFVLAVSTTQVLALNGTYYEIELNLEHIRCKMCPPGSFWIENCSQDGDNATCQHCPDGSFRTHYNREFYCRRCTKCTENDQPSGEVLVEACTRFHDTICGCKPGYWREEGVGDCREVSPCEPGHGVEKMANSHKDTTCGRCVDGKTFSNISSEVTPCQNCSVCPEGWVQKTACNESEDTLCVPKDEVEEDSVGVILGVACGVILTIVTIGIITFCCLKKRNEFLQKLHTRWRKEKLDEEKQANQQQPFMAPQ